ncbi:MAG: type 1 periplasmic binding fold superfamily protein [Bacteroidota bacterium]
MKVNSFLAAALMAVFFTSCQKDENDVTQPVVTNEEELITTLKVNLSADSATRIFQFRDPDGEGGANGTTDTIYMQAGKVYQCSLQFLNESNPAKVIDITTEIREEADDHLVCFDASDAVITRTDKDSKGLGVGLASEWVSSATGRGTITIRLRHQPGLKDGSCGIGETDIEVVFPVVVQ